MSVGDGPETAAALGVARRSGLGVAGAGRRPGAPAAGAGAVWPGSASASPISAKPRPAPPTSRAARAPVATGSAAERGGRGRRWAGNETLLTCWDGAGATTPTHDPAARRARPPMATRRKVTGITTTQACGGRSSHQTDMSEECTAAPEAIALLPARRAGSTSRGCAPPPRDTPASGGVPDRHQPGYAVATALGVGGRRPVALVRPPGASRRCRRITPVPAHRPPVAEVEELLAR